MSKFFEALNRRKGESVPWILPELNAASAEQSRDTTLEDMDALVDKPEGHLAEPSRPARRRLRIMLSKHQRVVFSHGRCH